MSGAVKHQNVHFFSGIFACSLLVAGTFYNYKTCNHSFSLLMKL